MSPIKIAVWSAIIEPGKEFHCIVPRDFVITNAALGEDLADPTGRSVVKLTHEIVPEKALRRPDFDEESDEEEEEEEEEELKELPSRTVVLTSLTAGKTEQSTLNLTFTEEDEIIITVTGQNVVHLSGNYLDQEPDANQDPDSDSEYDDYSDPEGEDWSDEEDMDDEMADESTASITEIPEKKSAKRSAAVAELTAPAATEAPMTKTEKKKQAKKLKTESGAAAAAPVEEKKAAAPAPKVEEKKAAPAEKKAAKKGPITHPNGLVVEDSKLGNGVVAKSGKKVGMRYIGKLGNGKVFDSNTNGKPFVFNLGRGEVIKGWDQGVAGMAIGGERKLTIPAALAYGNKALPGIPKNSTLHFEVKLVSVN